MSMKKVAIISNNCWGEQLYKYIKQEFYSPFIGLYINIPCYIDLLSDFDNLMQYPIKFIKNSKYPIQKTDYPIGTLDNRVEIHFMHYENQDNANEKWMRRRDRMFDVISKDNYFYKICDRDFCQISHILEFHKMIKNNKLSFGIEKINIDHHVVIQNANESTVMDGVELFHKSIEIFDMKAWLGLDSRLNLSSDF